MAAFPDNPFYRRQIALLEANDPDGLMTQYHDDAVLVGVDFVVRGKEAIRRHMEVYLARLGTLKLKETLAFAATDDAILFEATVQSDLGEATVYDAFVLRDGKATHQFTGVIAPRST